MSEQTMSFDKIIRTLIQHECPCDQQKRSLILKALQHLGKKNLTYEEAIPMFEICLTLALENSSNKTAILSLFAFAIWGNKFPGHLKEYMSVEQITNVLTENDSPKLMIILTWLKEILQILINDADYISSISPVSIY